MNSKKIKVQVNKELNIGFSFLTKYHFEHVTCTKCLLTLSPLTAVVIQGYKNKKAQI